MVRAIKHFRPYVYGRRLKVYTDHGPLRWLNSITQPEGRLARWSMMLSDYDLDIVYKPGAKNTDADGLSRAHVTAVTRRAKAAEQKVINLHVEGDGDCDEVSHADVAVGADGDLLEQPLEGSLLSIPPAVGEWLIERADDVWKGLKREEVQIGRAHV